MGLKALCKGGKSLYFSWGKGKEASKTDSFPKVTMQKTGRVKLSSTPELCFIHQGANERKQ